MIIGLTGYARSGKDTVAKILVDSYGYKRIAFADKIRELLVEINPILENGHTLNEMLKEYGWEVTKARREVRRLLQDTGIGARVIFGENFWIQQALRQVHFQENWVITDVRFSNEASAIKKYDDAQLWRVERPGVGAINDHVSESQLANFDVDQTILNSGSVEDLELLLKTRMYNLV